MSLRKVYIVTLGCSKNQIDSDLMESILFRNNYAKANYLEEADIIVVNTCGFIEDAKTESIDMIWEMTKYKTDGKCQYLILSGCLAQRYADELLSEIEEVDAIIGTGNIRDIRNVIDNLDNKITDIIKTDNINELYPEDIKRLDFNQSEYVKISEGCDNFCTYCIIPKLRGKHRSRPMEKIIEEVKYLGANGVKEIILIAQNTSDYGIDLYGEYSLHILLDKLNEIKEIEWIRLLYLYPDNFSADLIDSIKNNNKVLKYVDIPLQHINDYVLNAMNRKTKKEDILSLIESLRTQIPEIIIRTTFIVGFPGETDENFQELHDFVKEIKFDKLGVFNYSREEGTPAYNLPNHVSEETKEKRKNDIMETQKYISENKMMDKVNNIYTALIEEYSEENNYIARSYMDSPDIDGIIYVESQEKLTIGDFVKVRITDYLEYDLIGEVVV